MATKVLAIDPGRTTGVCLGVPLGKGEDGRHRFTVLVAAEIKWDDRFTLVDLIQQVAPDGYIVVERFNLRPGAAAGQGHIHSDFPSIQVIGIVQAYAHALGMDEHLVLQAPSIRRRVQVLEAHEDDIRGSEHIKDAYKHLRYFIVKHGGWGEA